MKCKECGKEVESETYETSIYHYEQYHCECGRSMYHKEFNDDGDTKTQKKIYGRSFHHRL